jgi:hypothetical protein
MIKQKISNLKMLQFKKFKFEKCSNLKKFSFKYCSTFVFLNYSDFKNPSNF